MVEPHERPERLRMEGPGRAPGLFAVVMSQELTFTAEQRRPAKRRQRLEGAALAPTGESFDLAVVPDVPGEGGGAKPSETDWREYTHRRGALPIVARTAGSPSSIRYLLLRKNDGLARVLGRLRPKRSHGVTGRAMSVVRRKVGA